VFSLNKVPCHDLVEKYKKTYQSEAQDHDARAGGAGRQSMLSDKPACDIHHVL
jgi:hypothetical protein